MVVQSVFEPDSEIHSPNLQKGERIFGQENMEGLYTFTVVKKCTREEAYDLLSGLYERAWPTKDIQE